ncbi:hypothetical protein BO70DRAFT_107683 [Aspergillus heteromorphus CBS 117.55]|uniref:Uncharacterized protein n=1 Tax=Aspergillus heteromorphus CBS 117.55 TaxID=1448321 RepID=A0A317VNL6_9EURO|nr:uncharacterized protein BO70DRAFT_107683 [Aspergillus heteromorphus CBS 117.55]PWY74458.1 hypothetical protein BO70DRAFT_107683 [Aspergillus heteromorphus CBS 117.55]
MMRYNTTHPAPEGPFPFAPSRLAVGDGSREKKKARDLSACLSIWISSGLSSIIAPSMGYLNFRRASGRPGETADVTAYSLPTLYSNAASWAGLVVSR